MEQVALDAISLKFTAGWPEFAVMTTAEIILPANIACYDSDGSPLVRGVDLPDDMSWCVLTTAAGQNLTIMLDDYKFKPTS